MYFPNEKKMFQIQTCQVTHGAANLSRVWEVETNQRKGEGGAIWALSGASSEGEGLAPESVGTDRRSWSSTRKC